MSNVLAALAMFLFRFASRVEGVSERLAADGFVSLTPRWVYIPSQNFAAGWCVRHQNTLLARIVYSLPWV